MKHGAHVLHGNPTAKVESDTRTKPVVVVDGLSPKMDIWRVDAFGPTVEPVYVDNDEEALQIANSTEYGLSSAVFTKDLTRAFRISRE